MKLQDVATSTGCICKGVKLGSPASLAPGSWLDCCAVGIRIEANNESENNFWKMFRPAQAQTKVWTTFHTESEVLVAFVMLAVIVKAKLLVQNKLQDDLEEEIQAGRDFTLTVTSRDITNKHAFEMHFKYDPSSQNLHCQCWPGDVQLWTALCQSCNHDRLTRRYN